MSRRVWLVVVVVPVGARRAPGWAGALAHVLVTGSMASVMAASTAYAISPSARRGWWRF